MIRRIHHIWQARYLGREEVMGEVKDEVKGEVKRRGKEKGKTKGEIEEGGMCDGKL